MTVDWNAVSAITNIIMAVATFAAVLVALWSTVYEHRPRIRAKFTSYGLLGTVDVGIVDEFVSVDVTNVGPRDVTVHSWGMKFKSSGQTVLIIENTLNPLYTSLPYKVEVDQTVYLQVSLGKFHDMLECYVKEGIASLKERPRFYVDYGPSKRKWVKCNMTVEEMVEGIEQNMMAHTLG